jgi:hypothetical protein
MPQPGKPGSTADFTQISIAALLIEHYFDRGFPALPADESWSDDTRNFIRQEFVLSRHSRWCPHCIKENGGRWMLRWRLS